MDICKVEKKVALIILDGLGIGQPSTSNAVFVANTPVLDQLFNHYPHATLEASGEAVGLPVGQMGNSEVGHMNLGAGRIVYQELGRINKAIQDGELHHNQVLQDAFTYAKSSNKKVHFIGLLSDGGVHAHLDHLKGLCAAATEAGLEKNQVFIHAFLDGRDTDPQGGIQYLRDLNAFLKDTHAVGQVASIVGRYYAMDRDHRWERVKVAYDLLVHGAGRGYDDLEESILESYENGVTDEFINPIYQRDKDGNPLAIIEANDVVICFNFRTDRGREITMALSQQNYPEWEMKALSLHYVTMTSYDETFKINGVLFNKENITHTLGEVLANAGKSQLRIAETEKYPHVTFFFSGGREEAFANERRILVPSPKVATYDMQPEMSAKGIVESVTAHLAEEQPDCIILNFANPDMVGHTGEFNAVVKAVETVDECLGTLLNKFRSLGYSILILADHGNAEYMKNEDGTPNTAHTTNLVPFIVMDPDVNKVENGKLGDIATTILHLMGIPIPLQMTGNTLVH